MVVLTRKLLQYVCSGVTFDGSPEFLGISRRFNGADIFILLCCFLYIYINDQKLWKKSLIDQEEREII